MPRENRIRTYFWLLSKLLIYIFGDFGNLSREFPYRQYKLKKTFPANGTIEAIVLDNDSYLNIFSSGMQNSLLFKGALAFFLSTSNSRANFFPQRVVPRKNDVLCKVRALLTLTTKCSTWSTKFVPRRLWYLLRLCRTAESSCVSPTKKVLNQKCLVMEDD